MPLSYLVYHLIGFENGINAYFEKKQNLENKKLYQVNLLDEITYYKHKLKLLDENSVDIDYLEEQSFLLGYAPKNAFTINLEISIKNR